LSQTLPNQPPPNLPAVDAQGVAKRFGAKWALRGIDLRVRRGESICLLGPNGSGKTTLLRVLASIARPTHGTVMVFGHSTAGAADEVRHLVGLLSHRSFLYGELTALENLQFASAMYGVHLPVTALLAALEAVGLAHAAHGRIRGFSQGMGQRLALARAMLHRPSLLLLDEPYSGLDAAALDLLDQQLREFQSQGGTLILVTHQLERGLAVCRRAVALASGRTSFDGTPEAFRATAESRTAGDWGTT